MTKFENLFNSIITSSVWEDKFKQACDKFKKDPTFKTYQVIKDDIASLRNRKFYKNEIDLLGNKEAAEKINTILGAISKESSSDKLKTLYGSKEDKESLVGTINTILNNPTSFPWAECNRIFIALHPELFCAIPFEANVNKLITLLNETCDAKIVLFDNWIDKAFAVIEFFKNNNKEIKEDGTNVTLPWQVLEALGGTTNEYSELLEKNHNLILTGAPGTGKTYLAKQVAAKIIGCEMDKLADSKRYGFVQFHPSYDYTDFVEGLRPKDNGGSNIGFERQDGIFKAFCKKAAVDKDESNKYVFVIDEINRGEISKIFGELFFSIDPGYRGKKGIVNTQYQNLIPAKIKDSNGNEIDNTDSFNKGFYVPKNVYVIGTMNDIDRSVESMDFAFRRRFAFHEITAEDSKQMLWNHHSWEDENNNVDKKLSNALPTLDKKMTALNKEILDSKYGLSSAYQIGGAYFLKYDKYKDEENPFESLWKYHLEGLLFEYLRGKPNALELIKSLKDVYDKTK